MDNLNVFQKTRIILLVLIIIASIVLMISVIKTKDKQNYLATETYSNLKTEANEIKEQIAKDSEHVEEIPGDVIETEDTSWDDQNVEETKVEEEELDKSKNKYYLKINYTANVVTAYTKDKDGKYTVPAKAMVCSTGKATPTSGVYKMSNKYRWHQLNGGVYGQYCSRITGHILFHSVPYATNSPDSLKYVAYDKLGTKASAGCIRLTVADAMWVFNNCASGTCVEFYSSSDPGPLGKPTAQKISSNEICRNWDPTDPSGGNPWHTYVEPTTTKTEETKTENDNKTKTTTNQNQSQQVNTKTETIQPQNNENSNNENQTTENTSSSGSTQEIDTNTTKEETNQNTSNKDSKEEKEEKDENNEESKPQEKEEKPENTETNEKTDNTEKSTE